MFYLTGIYLIFYLITLSDAVNLKIDGLINLGPNWSYEYRIVGPAGTGEKSQHSIARQGRFHLPEISLTDDTSDGQKEEVKREPVETVTEEPQEKKKHKHRKAQEKLEDTTPHIETTTEQATTEPTTTEQETKETTSDAPEIVIPTPRQQEVTFSSQNEESSDTDSDEVTTKKTQTMFVYDDFTTSKRPKKKSKNKDDEDSPTEYADDDDKNDDQKKNVTEKDKPIIRERYVSYLNPQLVAKDLLNKTLIPAAVTSGITTHRSLDIYSEAHKVKDDAKINDFTNHIYQQTLKVFDTIKQKTSEYYLNKELDMLARSYDDKFREFLSETRHQQIKTRLGTQKVILNIIDNSNRILNRLINFMVADMDKKGVLRNNIASANVFQKDVDNEQVSELAHACKTFGICRTGSGFPEFIQDILSILAKSDDHKLQHAYDALTEAVKGADYHNLLPRATEKRLKSSIENWEQIHIKTVRPMLLIMKNIITNKNRPIIVNSVPGKENINSTLAFLEMVDLFDQNLPPNEANTLEWTDIKTSLSDFSESKRFDVQEIMESFVKHLKKSVKTMDAETQDVLTLSDASILKLNRTKDSSSNGSKYRIIDRPGDTNETKSFIAKQSSNQSEIGLNYEREKQGGKNEGKEENKLTEAIVGNRSEKKHMKEEFEPSNPEIRSKHKNYKTTPIAPEIIARLEFTMSSLSNNSTVKSFNLITTKSSASSTVHDKRRNWGDESSDSQEDEEDKTKSKSEEPHYVEKGNTEIPEDEEQETNEVEKSVDVGRVAVDRTVKTTALPTIVATIQSSETYSDAHAIKHDATINNFTDHIYQQTIQVFESIKNQTNQYHAKKEMSSLMKLYQNKFHELLLETREQKIKSRLGAQKVVLNMIDMSNLILKRLFNFMILDLEKKGVLRNNIATAKIFQIEMNKEQDLELRQACTDLGICKPVSGFADYLVDVITIVLLSDNNKFRLAFDSWTESAKNADYTEILPEATANKLKASVESMENVHASTLRPLFMILKNIINNKNRPIMVTSAGSYRVNATLAFLDIIDRLDMGLPRNKENKQQWDEIKNNLTEFTEDKRFDIQNIMEAFVENLINGVKSLDYENQESILKNLEYILGLQ